MYLFLLYCFIIYYNIFNKIYCFLAYTGGNEVCEIVLKFCSLTDNINLIT